MLKDWMQQAALVTAEEVEAAKLEAVTAMAVGFRATAEHRARGGSAVAILEMAVASQVKAEPRVAVGVAVAIQETAVGS